MTRRVYCIVISWIKYFYKINGICKIVYYKFFYIGKYLNNEFIIPIIEIKQPMKHIKFNPVPATIPIWEHLREITYIYLNI